MKTGSGPGGSETQTKDESQTSISTTRDPIVLEKVEPEYWRLGAHGSIHYDLLLRVEVSELGDVTSVTVLNPFKPPLDAVVVQAVRKWKYQPALRDGRPVRATITVTFKLRTR